MAKNKKWGVVPYRKKADGTVEVLVVTTDNDNWVLPKGNLIKRIGRKKTALREAFEEAGAVGEIVDTNGTIYKGKDETLHLYPMHVSKLLPRWPEESRRKRKWVKAKKARRMLKRKSMQKAVKALAG